MTRSRLLAETSAKEITAWMAFFRHRALPHDRAELTAGVATSALVNTMRGLWAKNAPMTTPQEFMPFLEKEEPTDEQRAAKIAAALGAPGY